MQYYISGTIIFLVIEMLSQFAYYRYNNKHGGGAGSIAFLFVIATLNAARNSLSFFLLLIVCMGLSVVTQSLGSVMTRVRILTAFHFIFGGAFYSLWIFCANVSPYKDWHGADGYSHVFGRYCRGRT